MNNQGIGVRFAARTREFFYFEAFRSAFGSTQPYLQLIPADLSPWIKQQGRENEHCRGSVRLGPYLHFSFAFMAFTETTFICWIEENL